MKQYNIYANPQGNYEAVKKGWSWPAFFFIFLWAMVKKMWGIGVGVLIALIVVIWISSYIENVSVGESLCFNASLIAGIILAIKGNKWRGSRLLKRGYEYNEIVTAATNEGAISLYIKEKSEGEKPLSDKEEAHIS